MQSGEVATLQTGRRLGCEGLFLPSHSCSGGLGGGERAALGILALLRRCCPSVAVCSIQQHSDGRTDGHARSLAHTHDHKQADAELCRSKLVLRHGRKAK